MSNTKKQEETKVLTQDQRIGQMLALKREFYTSIGMTAEKVETAIEKDRNELTKFVESTKAEKTQNTLRQIGSEFLNTLEQTVPASTAPKKAKLTFRVITSVNESGIETISWTFDALMKSASRRSTGAGSKAPNIGTHRLGSEKISPLDTLNLVIRAKNAKLPPDATSATEITKPVGTVRALRAAGITVEKNTVSPDNMLEFAEKMQNEYQTTDYTFELNEAYAEWYSKQV